MGPQPESSIYLLILKEGYNAEKSSRTGRFQWGGYFIGALLLIKCEIITTGEFTKKEGVLSTTN
ncbi:MAG: hypothetical protein ACD_38C00126G0001 [uncultured bacterium]|nr:MAG: hypothetical protein ACD_38C00126G0001 [uncultured bacterium]HBD05509.1 hypothetical protein [Candidatus Uhrbacteria bacterium]